MSGTRRLLQLSASLTRKPALFPRRRCPFCFPPPQNFLVLRSLHQWLVEGRTPLSGQAAAAAAAPHGIPPLAEASESLSTLELLSLPGSVRVDAEFIGLVAAAAGGDDGGADGRGDTAGIYLFPSAASVPQKTAGVAAKEAALAGGDPSAATASATKNPPSKGGTGGGGEGARGIGSSASIAASLRGWYNWSGVVRRRGPVNLGPPRPGDRVRLTDKNYVACYLPFNWPGKPATAAPKPDNGGVGGGGTGWGGGLYRTLLSGYAYWTTPTAAAAPAPPGGGVDNGTSNGGRSSSSSARHGSSSPSAALPLDELYVVLDERSFMIAVPDPDSPLDGGILVCVAPLRNTAAKKHPANPRVLELRVSTREEGRAGSSGGPGLFLPVPAGEAVAAAEVGVADGTTSFKGAGHRGIWHLVRGLGGRKRLLAVVRRGTGWFVAESAEAVGRASFLAGVFVGGSGTCTSRPLSSCVDVALAEGAPCLSRKCRLSCDFSTWIVFYRGFRIGLLPGWPRSERSPEQMVSVAFPSHRHF